MPVGCGVSLALRGTGERGHRTIPEFDPAVLQPLLTLASDGPHRVVGPPLSCHGLTVMGEANRRKRSVTSPVASDRALPLETLDECCVRSGFRIRRWLPTGNPNHLFIGTLRRDALVQPGGENGQAPELPKAMLLGASSPIAAPFQ
jgi:hypothetical protein